MRSPDIHHERCYIDRGQENKLLDSLHKAKRRQATIMPASMILSVLESLLPGIWQIHDSAVVALQELSADEEVVGHTTRACC